MASATPLAPLKPRQKSYGGVSQQAWLWRLQGLLASYLPVLLMALLAAGTWWLVKNTPGPDGPQDRPAPRHVPDYRMFGFELQRFDPAGALRFRVEGAEMRHFPDTDTVEIDSVRIRAFGADGSLTVAAARRALGNGDGSELQLLGEVNVERYEPTQKGSGTLSDTPSLQIEGEFLHAFLNEQILRSHLPVRVRYAGGDLQARNFIYNHLKGRVDFGGRGTARFEPPARP